MMKVINICFVLFVLCAVSPLAAQSSSDLEQTEKENKGGLRGIFKSKKKKLKAENEALKDESEVLEKRLEGERKEKARLQNNLHDEHAAQIALEEAVSRQATALQSLSEEQARTKLRLLSQQMLADSLYFTSQLSAMKLSEQKMQLEQQKDKLEASRARSAALRSQKTLFITLAIFGALAAFAFYNRLKNIGKYNALLENMNKQIVKEKKRAEELLFNILPVKIANELQVNGAVVAKEFKEVTVMFSDFVNFTSIAERRTPQELVQDLDYCFTAFDRIIQNYNLEKIKTIGDAYMVAGGLPDPAPDHAKNMIEAAIEMQAFLKEWNLERKRIKLPEFHARIGIHTGEVVAGIVGERKFAFDIWGDCVNVAARMEHACAVDRINVSRATLAFVQDDFSFEPRGKVMTKNKGEIEMYYLEM